jgi:hypothetical protein
MMAPDSHAMAVLKAEAELDMLAAWFGALSLTAVARDRLEEAVQAIRVGLNSRRADVGLQPRALAVAA